MYLLLLAVIYLAFISLGLPDSALGSAWPTIYAELDIPISYLGIISMAISIFTILSSLVSDRVVAKFGTRAVTTFSILLTAVAMLGFSTGTEFYHMLLWAIPYGLGAGAIDAALNNYIALHYSSRHMSWLHCFWGVGTIISPYIMSYALASSSWQGGFLLLSIIQAAIFVVMLVSLPLWKVNAKKAAEQIKVEPIGIGAAVRIKGVLPVMLGFLCYCAAESTSFLWASSYFEGVFNMAKEEAAALGSMFFIGITAGRFICGFITERLGDVKMIRIGAIVCTIGIILSAIPILGVAIAGFIIIGLGCAPIYPCIMHSIPCRFGSERSQSIIGMQMAFAYLGSTLMPPLFGLIANHISLRLMPVYTAIFVIAMIILLSKADKDAPITVE